MAILVDDARWPWRGTTWCHLVSDSDLAELHDFARQLGCRRVGFQGDHYDIDVISREAAVELGAVPCTSRELVRRLKSAGLRLRPSQFTKWSLVTRGDRRDVVPVEYVPAPLAEWVDVAEGFFVLARSDPDTAEPRRALVLFGTDAAAIGDLPAESDSEGLYARVDRDGGWAIEFFTPPPTVRE